MSLARYKQKRSFSHTPEPAGGKASSGRLRFVIQKHDASHLHYDFRLEMDGVLKSWAVPKGPSTDPSVKRLAMMVEDHPYDYRTFEGIIPEGNYGAGTVIVWDEGTYEPLEQAKTKKEQEKLLLKQLNAGSLKFALHGKKLKGEFALVHTHGRGENSWLLIKHRDKYAATTDITKKDKSVVSGKTLAKVEATSTHIYGEDHKEPDTAGKVKVPVKKVAANKTAAKTAFKKTAAKKAVKPKSATTQAVKKKAPATQGVKKAFPKNSSPMLATLVDKPFDEEGWLYEIKWDGYRALTLKHGKSTELVSRNQKSFNEKFYPIYEAVKQWKVDAVVDGEIVVVNKNGVSNFGLLQNWRSEADGDLYYYVFDLLWLNGYDVTSLPLQQRRQLLKEQLPSPDGPIRMSENFNATATEFLAAAAETGLEGIIAKKENSKYEPGNRSRNWLKMKTGKRHEVVIGGFTQNKGSVKLFSSLLVGVYENGKLQYTGKIGTGFTEAMQKDMMKQFKPLITSKLPFEQEPDVNKPSRFRPDPPHASVTWLRPKLVCEVSYTEITSDGVMRHPSFEGMREDKKAKDVKREIAVPVKTVKENKSALHTSKVLQPAGKTARKTLLNPTDESQVRKVNGQELSFTNLDKIYWPKDKISKRDMLNYYYQVAPYILPYIKNRPQSLNRFPNGIDGQAFYQKDVTGKVPDWVTLFPYHSKDDKEQKNFMVCTEEAGLLLMANMGCIEINPWSSTVNKPDNPTWCIIDLDPGKNTPFDKVIEAANVTHQLLDAAGIPSYCKTSGSTGMHIYIPLGAKYTYEQSKEFARVIVTLVQAQIPAFTSIERQISARKGKLYLDFLQNRPQATLAAPYSVRPRPKASVSMPLHWEEVKKGLKVTDFTIANAIARIQAEGDLFKPVLGKGISLTKALKQLEVL
ncbi:bifunctional non-homologous end joining protein LigD [Filimonas lacunae]|uniref:DNA ligase (ATP) n=1 Tax=Filimonas lacunae TaxID=477680 RepID=A0A173MS60_9BACT|nr:DNA ligase D [Filimonas lacunae]BAV10366.1 ATP-dependent DNA ligase clustered with Ku protein, LigD [Filimonas lacunae]SIT16614.1 bifunctional non-homologous end joining protein LigD [Filimonas lacunae]